MWPWNKVHFIFRKILLVVYTQTQRECNESYNSFDTKSNIIFIFIFFNYLFFHVCLLCLNNWFAILFFNLSILFYWSADCLIALAIQPAPEFASNDSLLLSFWLIDFYLLHVCQIIGRKVFKNRSCAFAKNI
jgi:hypothetical protein